MWILEHDSQRRMDNIHVRLSRIPILPCRVMAGESNGHGWHRVLYNGEQLDVTQVEVTLLTEPGGRDERWPVVCILPV